MQDVSELVGWSFTTGELPRAKVWTIFHSCKHLIKKFLTFFAESLQVAENEHIVNQTFFGPSRPGNTIPATSATWMTPREPGPAFTLCEQRNDTRNTSWRNTRHNTHPPLPHTIVTRARSGGKKPRPLSLSFFGGTLVPFSFSSLSR